MSNPIKLPNFNHPEVRAFYEHDLSIPKEKVAEILKLPRATLIEDMETIILDGIKREPYFKEHDEKENNLCFFMHALWVLAELKAKESLPTVLQLLKQDSDFNWYWFAEYTTEDLWEIYYNLGNDELEVLKETMLNSRDWTLQIVPSTVAQQIYLYHPERKQEILAWYDSVLKGFINMEDGNEALNGDAISSIVVDLIQIQAKEFLPQIKILYDRRLVFNGITGDFESIQKDIAKPSKYSPKRALKNSIYKRYEDAMTWYGYQMKYNKEAYEEKGSSSQSALPSNNIITSSTPIVKPQKVSRNAPCPCGSGKKYKRCCLKK